MRTRQSAPRGQQFERLARCTRPRHSRDRDNIWIEEKRRRMGYRGRDPIDEFDGNDSGETKPPPARSCAQVKSNSQNRSQEPSSSRAAIACESSTGRIGRSSLRASHRVLQRQITSGALTFRCSSMIPAISCRIRGDVSAGVWIFSPPRLLIQEPRGQQRQGLMMVPGDPVPHLVIGQACLPLAAHPGIPRSDAPAWPPGRTPSKGFPTHRLINSNHVSLFRRPDVRA